jgi:cell division protein FtsL
MSVTFGDIAVGIGAAGTLGAIVVWWISRILDLRKEIIQLQMHREFDRQEINELKEEVKELKDYYNRGRNN